MAPIAPLRAHSYFAAVDSWEYACCGGLVRVGDAPEFTLTELPADVASGLFTPGVTAYAGHHEDGSTLRARVLRLWESRDDYHAVDDTGRNVAMTPGTTRVVEVAEMSLDTRPDGWVLELEPLDES